SRSLLRTDFYGLLFGAALLDSTDPFNTLLQITRDGKLGTLKVDSETVDLKESMQTTEIPSATNLGTLFSSWVNDANSSSCLTNCCLGEATFTQTHMCRPSCKGVPLERELKCVDFCRC
ncbi:hypothetical protein pdam_00002453, partial [Pocillopora damicornis]